jgi:hypothetical protein
MHVATTPVVTQDPAQSQAVALLLAQSTLYSATVAGKTYTADVGLASGQYLATVPDLPGLSASGSNRLVAENNLDSRIDLLA